MIKVAKKDLKNIDIEIDDTGGFVVWITERKKVMGRMKKIRHWIVDASCIKDDGMIRLGNNHEYKVQARYDEDENAIYITRS